MTRRHTTLLVVAVPLAAFVCVVASYYQYAEYREYRFLRDLSLVAFSTSMLGSPRDDQERAEEVGINLFAAYENNLKTNKRFDLAWMLIASESPEYIAFAKENVNWTKPLRGRTNTFALQRVSRDSLASQ